MAQCAGRVAGRARRAAPRRRARPVDDASAAARVRSRRDARGTRLAGDAGGAGAPARYRRGLRRGRALRAVPRPGGTGQWLPRTARPGGAACALRAQPGGAAESRRGIAAIGRASPRRPGPWIDRKSVVWGKSVSVRVELGVGRLIKKKKKTK